MNELIKSCLVKASFNFVIACAAYFPARPDEDGNVQELLDLELMAVGIKDGIASPVETPKALPAKPHLHLRVQDIEPVKSPGKVLRQDPKDYIWIQVPVAALQSNEIFKPNLSSSA